MKKILKLMFVAAMSGALAVTFTSCDDNDDVKSNDVESLNEVLLKKFPDVNTAKVDWDREGNYYVADFAYNGADVEFWVNDSHQWQMTEWDYGRNYQSIASEIAGELAESQSMAGDGWYVDDVSVFEHVGGSKVVLVDMDDSTDHDTEYAFKNGQYVPNSIFDYHRYDITPDCTIW